MALKKHLPLLIISAGLVLSLPVAGSKGMYTAWGAEQTAGEAQPTSDGSRPPISQQVPTAPEDEVILYDKLADLVKAFSPQVQMERTQYDSRLNRYEEAKEEIMETRRHLLNEADDMEKDGNTQEADNYRSQAKALDKSAKNMDKQITSAKSSSSTMSLRRMEDTMTWTAQNLMGTYNSLKAAKDGAAADAELMKSRQGKAERQAGLGMVPQSQVDEAQKAAAAAATKVQSLEDQMDQVRNEILMVTGYPPDSQVQIGPMPVPDQSRADQINLEVDKWRAWGNNYELRQQRGGSSGGTIKERHSRERAMDESESTLYGQMDTLYQNVAASRTAWQSACTAQEANEAQWKAASNKHDLGMLSDQDYLEAKSKYMNQKAAKAQADVNFQQALDTYDWAVKGFVKS